MTVHQAPERFGRVLVALQEAYRQPFSELAAALYADAVSELPIATIERAAADLIKTSKFLPKAAELRTAARAELTRTRDTRGPAPQPVALLPGRVAALRARQAADPGQQRSVRLWDAWQLSRRMIADGAAPRRAAGAAGAAGPPPRPFSRRAASAASATSSIVRSHPLLSRT